MMNLPNMEPIQILKMLYHALPQSSCKGLCQFSCGPIWLTKTEHEAIPEGLRKPRQKYGYCFDQTNEREYQQREGLPITADPCQYLTAQGKCAIYEYRPFICRTWGNVPNDLNICPYGCRTNMSIRDWEQAMRLYMLILTLDGSGLEMEKEHDKAVEVVHRRRMQQLSDKGGGLGIPSTG